MSIAWNSTKAGKVAPLAGSVDRNVTMRMAKAGLNVVPQNGNVDRNAVRHYKKYKFAAVVSIQGTFAGQD